MKRHVGLELLEASVLVRLVKSGGLCGCWAISSNGSVAVSEWRKEVI